MLKRREFIKVSAATACAVGAGRVLGVSESKGVMKMKKVDLACLGQENAFKLIANDWMLVCAGTKDKFNMMTASWGGIGWLWGKPVVFAFIRPERYTHAFVEREARFTLSFFKETWKGALTFCGTKSGRDYDKCKETGLTGMTLPTGAIAFEQARLVLDCRKLFKTSMTAANFVDKDILAKFYNPNPGGSLHDLYVGEIEALYAADDEITSL